MLLANAASNFITCHEGLVDGLPVAQKLQLSALARGVSLVTEGGLAVPPEDLLQSLRRSHVHHTPQLPLCAKHPPTCSNRDAHRVLEASLALRIEIAELLLNGDQRVSSH
jgi:hypothetical protein